MTKRLGLWLAAALFCACGDSDNGDTAAADATSDGGSSPGSVTGQGTAGSTSQTADSSSGGAASSSSTGPGLLPGATPENLRVAFFGDHGLGALSEATLRLVQEEDADFLVILGDFDYGDNPTAWHEQLDETLDTDFPVFAVAGNHDVAAWDGYRQVIMDRRATIEGADCQGRIGEQESCVFQGLHFVLTAVGTMGNASEHEEFITDSLAASESIWKICGWHKNQNDMQVGGKFDEVGWEAYRRCQDGGAIIATGHEHSYSRTVTLTDLGNEPAGHGNVLGGDPARVEVDLGRTFVFVSGLGGSSLRDYHPLEHDDDTWWATIFTTNLFVQNGEIIDDYVMLSGVTFIDFHVDGDPYKARGYFKSITDLVVDEFEISTPPR